MTTGKLTLVEVRGGDRALGVAQGLACRHRLSALYGSLATLPLGLEWLPTAGRNAAARLAVGAAGRIYLAFHRGLLGTHAGGRYLRMLEGLAEGFGVCASEVYGFGAFEVESGVVGFRMGCTALAVSPSQTSSGAPRLAYNHDFPTVFGPHLILRRSGPQGPHLARSLCLTYEIAVGAIAGVNEHGLAVTVNQVLARAPRRRRPALLPTFLVQDCLDHCHSVADAVTRLRALPVPVGSALTLVDAGGDRAVVEVAPAGHAVHRPGGDDQLLVTFNAYRCAETEVQQIPVGAQGIGLATGYDLHAANIERQRRFDELTTDHTGARAWTDDALHAILADHDGGAPGSNTLCRHDTFLGGDTIVSALLDPAARTLRARRGFACAGPWGDPVGV